jgi:folate-dependent phosphoribosylglycinamide formyltransferase PurN
MQLSGLVVITDTPGRRWAVARRELRCSGWLRLVDVLAFRLFVQLWLRRGDEAWKQDELMRLTRRYPADLSGVPRLSVTNPNDEAVSEFLKRTAPDLLIARCKFILRPHVFEVPRVGAFALHPGVCPEYRNAHGCFWALVNRDLERVGMTLLKIDKGVDTGAIYLQAGCRFDERRDSHTIIQYRAVTENLDAIGRVLTAICEGGEVAPIPTTGRRSAVWGQPRLTSYLRWKKLVSNHALGVSPVS